MEKARRKWHWMAGGGTILVFAVLLAIRLGIPGKIYDDAQRAAAGKQAAAPSGETWLNITQNGHKIGYARRLQSQSGGGFHYGEEIRMRINMMGIVQPIAVRTEAELKPDGTLSSFQFELRSNLFGFKARGSVDGTKLTILSGAPGSETQSVLPLAETPYLGGGILTSAALENLMPGEVKTFPVLDPASLGQRPARVTLLAEEPLTVMGKSRMTRKYEVDYTGMKQFAWIDEEGSIVRETGILGIALERVAKEEALAGLEGGGGVDLADLAAIPSSVHIEDPEKLTRLKIRIAGFGEQSLSLDGGRQAWRDGVLTIRREADVAKPGGAGSYVGNLQAFLEPTPFIQADHPKIGKALKGIVAANDPEEVKARKIVAWVYKYLEKRPVLSVPNALETLEQRMGDCNEHAVLLAALARAAGIPAQVEAGVVYLRGRFYYHAWNVLFLKDRGGWMTADAALGQMPADVTHIRFVRGAVDRQLDLLGIIGKLNMEILETAR